MGHETFVLIAKTVGLIYLMGFFLIAAVWIFRPSGKASADRAAHSILTEEDPPCQ